ncbi:MAG: 4-amino-4-deoxychorismate lyase [Streptosporangiales bacterium]|nr:4-amino-4-deoxychorismate lyase [Streptosporangiales bacterium]
MRVWLNTGLVEASEAHLSAFDHGLTVGDGVFETIKVTDGVTFALTRHLKRLARSAAMIGLPEPDLDLARRAAEDVVAANTFPGLGRLRVTFTGGVAPLGSERGADGPTLLVAVGQQPLPTPTVDVTTVPWPRNERGALAGVKSTSYAENVVALGYAKQRGGGEAIFGNLAGDLCEGTGSNIFVVVDGELVTPTLESGCLAGVTRALVLEWVGAAEKDMPLSVLADVDEAFLCGTTRDVQPIRAADGRVLPAAPGPITQKAMEVFASRAAEGIDP